MDRTDSSQFRKTSPSGSQGNDSPRDTPLAPPSEPLVASRRRAQEAPRSVHRGGSEPEKKRERRRDKASQPRSRPDPGRVARAPARSRGVLHALSGIAVPRDIDAKMLIHLRPADRVCLALTCSTIKKAINADQGADHRLESHENMRALRRREALMQEQEFSLTSDLLHTIASGNKKIREAEVAAAVMDHACLRLPPTKGGLIPRNERWKRVVSAAVRGSGWRILACPFAKLAPGQFHKIAGPMFKLIGPALTPGRKIHLSIEKSELNAKDGGTIIDALAIRPGITRLTLSDIQIRADTLERVALALQTPGPAELSVTDTDLYLHGTPMPMAWSHPRLQTRDLMLALGGASLGTLRLRGNRIGNRQAETLAAGFSSNTRLASLDVSSNKISSAGGRAFGAALKMNTSLTQLDLSGNRIGKAGMGAIAAALMTNTTLAILKLAQKGTSDPVVSVFTPSLAVNQTLRYLELYAVSDSVEDMIELAGVLKKRRAGLHLTLVRRGTYDAGARALHAAAERNPMLLIAYR